MNDNRNPGCFPSVDGYDLLPCPFCGSPAVIEADISSSGDFPTKYLACCSECCGMIEVWWDTPEAAAEAWNERADP